MNVIYNSKHFWVLLYPAQQGFELIDKSWLRTLYLDGADASAFCRRMSDIPQGERTHDAVDALLDEICNEAAQPVIVH